MERDITRVLAKIKAARFDAAKVLLAEALEAEYRQGRNDGFAEGRASVLNEAYAAPPDDAR